MLGKWNYLRRIFKVYLTRNKGYLSFWHETPAVSEGIKKEELGPYYMTFADKAAYTGPKDKNGVILFDYYFDIGRQYNPLAVAQYGLGHYNLYLTAGDKKHFDIAKTQADWLVDNLEKNDAGFYVWKHKFRWHYKQNLEPGWYSAHSQGTGISFLGRMYKETKDEKYLETAQNAFESLTQEMKAGGVQFTDGEGNVWLEEYMVDPPTHILNGFLWALWGVWDMYLLTGSKEALDLWNGCVKTLEKNLHLYDAGFWSLYDLSKQKMKMIASPFYHKLHIVQLKATHILSDDDVFEKYADLFEKYQSSTFYRTRAFVYKVIFKLIYF